MALISHNPDVLTCIANLSNDEVFTPPEIAKSMLDRVEEAWAQDNNGEVLWENPNIKFLDPFTKSGIFLREITERLIRGLSDQIPDLQERVNHILTQQVFGIAITNLTGLISRRSVYCSKKANGQHSICTAFNHIQGNIWFNRTEHTWVGGKLEFRLDPISGEELNVHVNRRCLYCGASEIEYARSEDLETHAYAFIHSDDVSKHLNEIFGGTMQFDVVIGNPPYQLGDGGAGKSARPLYQLFVESAKKLDPRYISLIIPSRWMAGGKGLDDFRRETLSDRRMRQLVDYIDSDEAFPGVDIAGGVSYFLWDRDNPGLCDVETHIRGRKETTLGRDLNEYDIFIRYADALSIVKKIWPNGVDPSKTLQSRMSGRNAFGFGSTARGSSTKRNISNPITLISSQGESFVSNSDVKSNKDWVGLWKATVSRASPAGGRPDKSGRFYGLSSIRVVRPNSVTTEAYPVVGAFETEAEAERMCCYLRTKFVRFLLTLRSANQSVGRQTFGFVPDLPMDTDWTDALLQEKYSLDNHEISFIDSMVRSMETD